MSTIQKVTAFRTSDGAIHQEPEKAQQHERKLQIATALRSFYDSYANRSMDAEDMLQVMVEHSDELHALLTKAGELPEV